MRTVCVTLQRMRVERRVFYPKISKRSSYVQHCTCTQKVAWHCMFNIKEFQACFSTFFVCCKEIYFTWEKCVQFTFKLHWMRVERRLFYPKISKRSYYVQHCTCTQNVAIYSIFNIQEFKAAFSTLYCRVSNCNVHRIIVYTALLHWRLGALKVKCFRVWSCFFQR